jgi:thiamine biosynthesis lipoprotein
VGVQDPAAGPDPSPLLVRVLRVSDRGVTTSGHYRRYSTIAGKRYSHILDPRTGRPVEQAVASVTVVAADAAAADGLSTAVAVLGLEKGLALIESIEGTEALVLTEGDAGAYRFHATAGMRALFEQR